MATQSFTNDYPFTVNWSDYYNQPHTVAPGETINVTIPDPPLPTNLAGLPPTDPLAAGKPWNNGGFLGISGGS